ncbi:MULTISPECIES: protein translocase subunit SecF [Pseudomonadaceae]|uniref:Protein-export membrane protein SecF n=1 Tax=Pseudomonas saudiphocaensis TaxID=1499686 RepID=A0A078LSB0_9PSED|nr:MULTISPECIES: protein translocase subunit SecF [Pseudomonadaceae]MBE7926885.1 protein translocase subunit SecF [Pseudomonas saudiphocaensis]MCF6783042.1 protein translocase subunit SecF [Stutzerimonas stutzeri]MCF6805990.1 protein translocase subunit SecF [Stutzerimonas stutzeri]RRV14949.1 protein translocase subunit SecF [Pseudomonas saudiphocaensis]CDZ94014.1 protein-export membrane protein SecF [Pseudomonas saudiphocaensis]
MIKNTIRFMAIRNVAFAITLLLTVIGLVSLFGKGLNFGLDFTGGTLIELQYEQAADLELIKSELNQSGYTDAVVQSFGATTDVLVRMAGDDPDLASQVAEALRKIDPDSRFEVKRVEFVGPQVGEELRDQGGLAMLLALGGILVYLAFRFQWKFGVGAIASLAHDTILTLGILSFFEVPFDLTVLAAVLAMIGYSLNDTIIIYDRIRENFRVMRKADLIENIDVSVTQTLLRTMATSFSTALALIALLAFGGDTLANFALALLIGVVVGTYSSVYIGATVLVWLKLTSEDLAPPVTTEVDETP